MIPLPELKNANLEQKDEVIALAREATQYLRTFKWCQKITNGWLVKEFGFILSIFYFELIPAENSGADTEVWIITGDLPAAYIDPVSASTPYEALEAYCEIMEDWIAHVMDGQSVADCYPVDAPATKENAAALESRIELLRNDFLPYLQETEGEV